MSQSTLEQIIAGINSLSSDEQRLLRSLLTEQLPKSVPLVVTRRVASQAPIKDLTRESLWLEQHCDEYAGQWVALDGDRLISSDSNAKKVYTVARAAGIPDALIMKVKVSDSLPFAGF
ncbi:MAG: DUF5678 domain-containing protein [Pyrinomonadaceae bacterium]